MKISFSRHIGGPNTQPWHDKAQVKAAVHGKNVEDPPGP
ncbi:hypothetical protein F8B43_3973 [Methylorubrum populi]|uniref:Uncharacterized protein n=1 Tax=Methylorubrum populi TaxID=223967 RepID=A0A833N163_9HYPH|nr:hypothetical protein F8B43_3973 [Methylorubrum populi]